MDTYSEYTLAMFLLSTEGAPFEGGWALPIVIVGLRGRGQRGFQIVGAWREARRGGQNNLMYIV